MLEYRKVFLSSAYYSSENTQIPEYIHDIFKNGLPADFRLIGATTRSPSEIPPEISTTADVSASMTEKFMTGLWQEKFPIREITKEDISFLERNTQNFPQNSVSSGTRRYRILLLN